MWTAILIYLYKRRALHPLIVKTPNHPPKWSVLFLAVLSSDPFFSLCVCMCVFCPPFSFVIPSGKEYPHLYSTPQPCCWHGFCAFLFFLCFFNGQGSAIVHPQTVLKTWLVPLDFLWWISFEYLYILIYKIWLKSSFLYAVSIAWWNLTHTLTHTCSSKRIFWCQWKSWSNKNIISTSHVREREHKKGDADKQRLSSVKLWRFCDFFSSDDE